MTPIACKLTEWVTWFTFYIFENFIFCNDSNFSISPMLLNNYTAPSCLTNFGKFIHEKSFPKTVLWVEQGLVPRRTSWYTQPNQGTTTDPTLKVFLGTKNLYNNQLYKSLLHFIIFNLGAKVIANST